MIIKGKGKSKSKTEMRITMIDKIDGYVFTEMEIQILASMMGKTKIYGFENQNCRDGDLLRKNTYESIYSLARKNYLEYVNKSTKIYLLELSKLTNKDEISFFELDNRLKKLESNYIISIKNKKIISITTFDNANINFIIEGLGE